MRLPFTAKCGYGEGVMTGWAIGRDELVTIKKTMKFSPRLSRGFGSGCVFSRALFIMPPDHQVKAPCKNVSFHILDLNFFSFLDV